MDERIKEKLINRAKTNPYVNFLGIDFTVIEEGRVEAHMPLHDEQRQYSGVTHGGVLAALADTIAGFAAYTMTPLEKDVLTAELKMSFLRAAWGNELIAKGEAALLTSPTVLVREYSGMMPEQAVQQAFRRQTGEYPEPAARSAWEDIRRREQQAEQRRAAAAEKAKAEPRQPSADAKPLPDGLNEDEKTIVTLVRDGVSTPEELIDRCGLAAPRVMSLVTMLEMDGILRREKGRLILGTW